MTRPPATPASTRENESKNDDFFAVLKRCKAAPYYVASLQVKQREAPQRSSILEPVRPHHPCKICKMTSSTETKVRALSAVIWPGQSHEVASLCSWVAASLLLHVSQFGEKTHISCTKCMPLFSFLWFSLALLSPSLTRLLAPLYSCIMYYCTNVYVQAQAAKNICFTCLKCKV